LTEHNLDKKNPPGHTHWGVTNTPRRRRGSGVSPEGIVSDSPDSETPNAILYNNFKHSLKFKTP
jgi:hypothetical protein